MHNGALLVTKLIPPRSNRWHLERPHLTAVLEAGLSRRLTSLIAAAGHGKTTALAHFLGRAAVPYLWLQLDSQDCDLTTFCTYLTHGITGQISGGQRAAALLRTSGPPPGAGQLLPLLVQDLMSCPPAAVVLDDFHLIDRGSPVNQMVHDLIQYGPDHVHFFICSRTPLPFAKANQEAADIREDDLRFTPDEVRTYYAQVVGVDLDDQALEHISHLTEGWPAALVLLAATLRRRGSVDALLRGSLPSDLFSYLADEVLAGLPANVREFLEATCILDTLTSETCDALRGSRDSAAILAGLGGSHLLITQVGPDSFRYHHLFQRFLQDRLKLRAQGETFRTLHRRAGDWFFERQMPEEAVRHYLHGGCLNEAAALVEDLAPLWLRTNRLDRLRGVLAFLPAEMKEQYPWISLCEARQQLNAGSLDAAMGMARLALRNFSERDDVRGAVQARTVIGEIYIIRQQYDGASAAYHQAMAELTPELRHEEAALLERKANLKMLTLGVDPDVEHDALRALALYVELGDLAGEGKASELLGLIRARMGDYASTVRLMERSVAVMQSLGEPPHETGVNLGWVYYHTGRFRDAIKVLEPMLASSTRKGRRAYAAENLVGIHTRLGDFQRAAALAQQAHTLGEEWGHREFKLALICDLVALYRLSGQYEAAVPYAQEALQLAKGMERLNYYLAAVLEAVYLHLFHTGNAPAARRMAEKGLARVTGESERWEWMLLALCAAVAAFRQARTVSRPEAVRLLNEGLAECSRRGYEFFALHEWPLALTVAIYGLAYGVQADVCLDLLRLMASQLPANIRQSGVALADAEARLIPAAWQALPDEEARQCLSAVLTPADRRRVMSLAAGPLPVRIHCLGVLRVTVGTQRVDRKALRRRKAGRLLVLLLANAGPVPRGQVLEKLWPHLDPNAADPSLRVAIHHLRRLLEPDLGSRGKSRYIQAEGGLVWFSRRPEVTVDLDRFTQLMDAADAAATGGDPAAAVAQYDAASRLYQGDLLADEPYAGALDRVRQSLRERYAAALSWLGEYCWKELQDPARAILYFRQRLTLDDAFEPAHQALMRLHLETGQVAEARQQYLICRAALQRNLGVQPSRRTESLHQLAISMERTAPLPAAAPPGRLRATSGHPAPRRRTHSSADDGQS